MRSLLPPLSSVGLTASLVLLSACGSVSFQRASGAKRHRPIPTGMTVTVTPTTDNLPTPLEVLGTLFLRQQSTDIAGDRAAAEREVKATAARAGCDAVVGLMADKPAAKSRANGAGKQIVQWRAQCVRTPRVERQRRSTITERVTHRPSAAPSRPAKVHTSSQRAAPSASGVVRTSPAPGPVATEVARAVLLLSRAFVKGQANYLCSIMDKERVYFDISSSDPQFRYRKDVTGAEACAGFKSGELSRYLSELGPADVHSDPSNLIPSLFRIHGGAFMKLTQDERVSYRTRLREMRAGKRALACEMYHVIPADNLFKVTFQCAGVRKYNMLLRRDGKNNFKLMSFIHLR